MNSDVGPPRCRVSLLCVPDPFPRLRIKNNASVVNPRKTRVSKPQSLQACQRQPHHPVLRQITCRDQKKRNAASAPSMRIGALLCVLPAMAWQHLKEIKDPQTYAALLYEPQGSGPWPLLLYLHGAGESGSNVADLISEGATGTPPVALEKGNAIDALSQFVVVAPQTSRGWAPDEVAAFVKFLQGRLSLDASRLYVTGHSMGGSGALHAATTGVFAACAAVAPAGVARPRDLMQVPVWAFHGRNDVIVPAAISERLITAMHRAGASPDQARLTLYDEAPTPPGWPSSVGHASTIPAYSDPELYSWLLRHTKSGV